MAYPLAARQERKITWSSRPPAGLLGMLAAPAIPRDTLLAALSALPASGIAPLLERLSYHRIDGLAYRTVSRLPQPAVDPWLRATLKRRHQRCTAATLVQGMAMAEVLQCLTGAGIRVAVLGGLRSVESIYGDAGARPIAGHDLLVLPADHESAGAALRRLGFGSADGVSFRRGGMMIELRIDALSGRRRLRRAAFPLSTADLMKRATAGRVAGAPAMLLSPEDELILLAVGTVGRSFDRLIGVADLSHLIASQGCALDWTALRRRAAASHTSRLLGMALKSTSMLGVAPPWEVKLEGSSRWLERMLLQRNHSSRPLSLSGEILVALSAPGMTEGLRCLVDALIPMVRPGAAHRRPPSSSAGHDVVAFRPGNRSHFQQEESVHGR